MNAESLGFQFHHGSPETYCPDCGVPESSNQHGMDCPSYPDRPTYPQRHPAMSVARNIVNQILDEAGTDVDTRQRINDDCDQFVAWMVERYSVDRPTVGGPA